MGMMLLTFGAPCVVTVCWMLTALAYDVLLYVSVRSGLVSGAM